MVHGAQANNNYSHEGLMSNTEKLFLKRNDEKLWKATGKLRSNLVVANCQHLVLSLINFFSGISFTKPTPGAELAKRG